MDMTVTLGKDGRFTTKIYAKPLALYLYLPPNSAHPPGVLTGLVFGEVLRIMRLCSSQHDAAEEVGKFYRRVLDRGHRISTITPLFEKAVENATKHMGQGEECQAYLRRRKEGKAKRQVYLHLP